MSLTRPRVLPLGAAVLALLASKLWLRTAPGAAIRWATTENTDRATDNTEANRPDVADTMSRAVAAVAARWPFHATCLEQSIALVLVLSRLGVPARVAIGVARSGSTLNGHACVQSSGRVVLGGAQMEGLFPLTGH